MKTIKTVIILIFTLVTFSAEAKSRSIHIKSTLENAEMVAVVTIYGYTDSTMLYGLPGAADTLSFNCRVNANKRLMTPETYTEVISDTANLAGKWPPPGHSVLMVTAQRSRLLLFAMVINDKYRFWDPRSGPFANSIFWIKQTQSFMPLKNCGEYDTGDDNYPNYWICPDGCYAKIEDIDQYLKEKHE